MRREGCKRSSQRPGRDLEFSTVGYKQIQYNGMRFLGMTRFLNKHGNFLDGMRVRCALLKKINLKLLYVIVTSFVSFVKLFAKKDKSE